MLVLISGGVRSGKSALGETLAQRLCAGHKIYLATARVSDEEMRLRVKRHQRDRAAKNFVTIEKAENVGEAAAGLTQSDTVLLDCLGNLAANELFHEDCAYDGRRSRETGEKLFTGLMRVNAAAGNLIVISNEIFSDGVEYDRGTRDYIEVMGRLHRKLAAEAQAVVECVYGLRIYHKGEML